MKRHLSRRGFLAGALGVGLVRVASGAAAAGGDGELSVVCTTTDLASLVSEVGGARCKVVCLAKGPEDPHTLELKPSFSRDVDRADLFVQVGLGIENAWLKDLMATVRSVKVRPGAAGHFHAGNVGGGVRALEGLEAKGIPGSFHEEGNPHYLLDPMEGLRVARELAVRLAELRPAWKAEVDRRFADFRLRLGTLLVGGECAREADWEALVLRLETVRGEAWEKLRKEHAVGGLLGSLAAHRGREVVGDHDLWPYFARRCGVEILGYLEPSPGSPPTTRHLQELVGRMRERKVGVVLSNPYFEPRHAEFVARATGARIVAMAHQTGARPGTAAYLEMVAYNGRQLLEALSAAPR